eukprot:augustus_masked-scaffold_51-processed-gene-1.75-mRNA-1 protein AED:1.00 eAED:1.00 QI:0/-1/0/0/-1/1/1/0/254
MFEKKFEGFESVFTMGLSLEECFILDTEMKLFLHDHPTYFCPQVFGKILAGREYYLVIILYEPEENPEPLGFPKLKQAAISSADWRLFELPEAEVVLEYQPPAALTGNPKHIFENMKKTEAVLLSNRIQRLVNETNIIPRKAASIDVSGRFVSKPYASCFHPDTTDLLNNYAHCRPVSTFDNVDINDIIDLKYVGDTITDTFAWTAHYNQKNNLVVLQSMLYVGYVFCQDASNGKYTQFYYGDGLPNYDFAYMR